MSGIIVRCAILAGALGLLAASASAQVVSAPVITANPVGFAWNANDAAEKVVGYQLEIDQTVIDVGAVLNYATTIAPGSHAVQVRAYSLDQSLAKVLGPYSAPPLAFSVTPVVSDDCGGHPETIAVSSWTQTVPIGGQGKVFFDLLNPYPIVRVEARLNSQTIGAMDGADLRATPGIKFSVPRTPGTYGVTVFAKDNAGCFSVTTLARAVVVQ